MALKPSLSTKLSTDLSYNTLRRFAKGDRDEVFKLSIKSIVRTTPCYPIAMLDQLLDRDLILTVTLDPEHLYQMPVQSYVVTEAKLS